MQFQDRAHAGQLLAQLLIERGYDREEDVVVLGLPRGGVPVAYQVAKALGAPLDVWVVRKVGAPDFPELGLGAVAERGIVFVDDQAVDAVGATHGEIQQIVEEKAKEVAQRVRLFRGGRSAPELTGQTIILVDDGIATGGTVRAAVRSVRTMGPKKLVLATPVAASQSIEELRPLVDDIACVLATPALYAIGAWYDDFHQVPDHEVIQLLELARGEEHAATASLDEGPVGPQEISIPVGNATLQGHLSGPASPTGLVLFAHGSGSSRFSPRNRRVAAALHGYGLATLLFDLLTDEEAAQDEQTAEWRFDIDHLALRLVQVTEWVSAQPVLGELPVGYFGSSTGAAAALVAAAKIRHRVHAVVSRGGRPDLAGDSLKLVHAPTLFIVGGEDEQVLMLNERAAAEMRMTLPPHIVIIPGATHLFEEPGALDAVARLAGDWFAEHLKVTQPVTGEAAAPPA